MGNKNTLQTNEKTGISIWKDEVKAKTENQKSYVLSIAENDITICIGKPGTGKTHLAVAMACSALYHGMVKHIVVTRPVVETGRGLGFLPGTFEEKMHPYLIPIMEEMKKFFPLEQIEKLRREEKIRIIPLEYMRGMNLHDCFAIGDEFQNATMDQLKMFMTRMGSRTKMVINGDLGQSDLRDFETAGLQTCVELLKDVDGVGVIELHSCDIIRHPLISKVLDKLKGIEDEV